MFNVNDRFVVIISMKRNYKSKTQEINVKNWHKYGSNVIE